MKKKSKVFLLTYSLALGFGFFLLVQLVFFSSASLQIEPDFGGPLSGRPIRNSINVTPRKK